MSVLPPFRGPLGPEKASFSGSWSCLQRPHEAADEKRRRHDHHHQPEDRDGSAALVVLAAASGIAQAATSKPSGMSQAEYRALMARSAGLNERYRLGAWKGVPEGLSPAEYRALSFAARP